MRRPSLTYALRLVAVSIIVVSGVYIYLSVLSNSWDELWYLYVIPVFFWWILDIIFNYTTGPIFYRGTLPAITVSYILLSILSNQWINNLFILTFIPFFVLVYNSKFYPIKYSVIPIVASFLGIIYVGIGLFMGVWHPTWLMFLIVPIIPLLQTYD